MTKPLRKPPILKERPGDRNVRTYAGVPIPLILAATTMYAFIKRIAVEPCFENPGEFPEPGESGQAPCLSCQARAALAEAEPK